MVAFGQWAGMDQGMAPQNVTHGWSQESFGQQGTPPPGMGGGVNSGQEVRFSPRGTPPAARATEVHPPPGQHVLRGGGIGQQCLIAVATTMPAGYSGIGSYLEKLGPATDDPGTVQQLKTRFMAEICRHITWAISTMAKLTSIWCSHHKKLRGAGR
jgi:hypothetical protein